MNDVGRDQRGGKGEDVLPPFSRRLFGWFMWHVRKYVARNFHAVRLLKEQAGGGPIPRIAGEPVIFYSNHPGWWDPLTFLLVGQTLFPDRMVYGPIDAAALGKYKFMERIGFIGIDPQSRSGASRFLRTVRAAAERTDVIYWITAQGEFTDPRRRPAALRPGVGHAAAAADRGLIVPLVVEYPFWNERSPEALVAFGQPIRLGESTGRTPDEWTAVLSSGLEAAQDRLAEAALARDPARFATLLSGHVGVGGVYDAVRRLKAFFRGDRFDASHGGEREPR
ncbi:MAG: lysophospholipid acyltransferase family protein [Planctomycetes bacterium]|nr:lysophospholipid acyltransferase family protein [Planctomycetota bacterium]